MQEWRDFESGLDRAMPRGWDPAVDGRSPLARWAQKDEILISAWRWREGDASLYLGKYQNQGVARLDDNRHVITVAGTRAGKGRSLILPNLALWPGSVIAIDPKGELATKTAEWRHEGLGQSVLILDPFGVSRFPSKSYNPLDDLDPQAVTFMDDVSLVADALIIGSLQDSHWTDGAKNLVRVIILYMFATGGDVSLPRLRSIILGREGNLSSRETKAESIGNLFLRMQAVTAFDGYVALAGTTFFEKSERELSSILSVAREQLAFLDSEAMRKVLQSSGFSLPSVKKHPTTVYLCLPAARLSTHFRWLRVMVNLALVALGNELENHKNKDVPVLLLLEEFAALEKMDAIEKAAGQIAGFGVKLWAVLQDLGQLEAIYGKRWETFFGNSGITTWFGLNDNHSMKYVSERLGDTHFIRKESNFLTPDQRGGGAAEYRESLTTTKLLSPEEVGRLFARETGRILVMHPGSRPMILQRIDAGHDMFKGKIYGEHNV